MSAGARTAAARSLTVTGGGKIVSQLQVETLGIMSNDSEKDD